MKSKFNRHIFITGVSKGLGFYLYQNLIEMNNSKVTIIGKNNHPNNNVKDCFQRHDLAKKFKKKIKVEQKVLDIIFISNAGTIDPIMPSTMQNFKSLYDNHMVNFYNPFIISTTLSKISAMRKVPLYILNISSGAASKPVAGWSAYCSSKASVSIALDCLKEENNRVKVLHINPGIMNTEMQKTIRATNPNKMKDVKKFIMFNKENKLLEPSKVAPKIIKNLKRFINENSNTI